MRADRLEISVSDDGAIRPPEPTHTAEAASIVDYAAAERLRVLYVMGYGRSGSTLLDILLGSHGVVTSAGELFELPDWWLNDRKCSCGLAVSACPFWGEVIARLRRQGFVAADVERLVRSVERRRRVPRLIAGRLDAATLTAYRAWAVALFEAIAARGGRRTIVDSSKSARLAAGRVLALDRFTDLDVRAILLVRDARAVVASCMSGKGSPERARRARFALLRGFRALCGWSCTNAFALMVCRRFGPERSALVSYEELVTDSRGALGRIGAVADIDFEPVIGAIEAGQSIPIPHLIGGNRLRFDARIRLRRDAAAVPPLPLLLTAGIALLARPVSRLIVRQRRRDDRQSAGRSDSSPDTFFPATSVR